MAPLMEIPTQEEMISLIGGKAFSKWTAISYEMEKLYRVVPQWNEGGKKWKYECKYRRGNKTLCALYARQDRFGFMIIFGREERERVEAKKPILSSGTIRAYDQAECYHDGKWVMFDEAIPIEDVKLLLAIKRKPDKI